MSRPPRFLLAFALAVGCSRASTDASAPGGAEAVAVEPRIDEPRMFAALEHLASDDLAGRFSLADEHIREAARYIAETYRSVGLSPVGPSYLIDFQLAAGSEPSDDFHFWIERDADSVAVADDAFATLTTSDDEAVVGDVVLVDPADMSRVSPRIAGSVALVWLSPEGSGSTLADRLAPVVKASPAALVVVRSDELPDAEAENPLALDGIPAVEMRRSKALELLQLEVGATPSSKVLSNVRVSLAPKPRDILEPVPNVLATLTGTERPEEIVVLGAHYDHIGTDTQGIFCRPSPDQKEPDTICNGADDNASGTAMVLEIARALAEAGYRPKRTIVFAHFAGEELGLHGSKALAEKPPALAPFEGGRVVAMINLDMVGRLGEQGLAIGGIGSSSGWMDILRQIDDHDLPIIYERAISGRSDHASFYEKDIPVLFFFTGVHSDYHRAGDEPAKINREGMHHIALMVADTLLEVADGAPLPFTPARTPEEGVVPRLPGTNPATLEPHPTGGTPPKAAAKP